MTSKMAGAFLPRFELNFFSFWSCYTFLYLMFCMHAFCLGVCVVTELICMLRMMYFYVIGFFFSSYRLLGSNSPALFTMDSYLRMLQSVTALNNAPTRYVRCPIKFYRFHFWFATFVGIFLTCRLLLLQYNYTSDIPKQKLQVMMTPGTSLNFNRPPLFSILVLRHCCCWSCYDPVGLLCSVPCRFPVIYCYILTVLCFVAVSLIVFVLY